MSDGDFAQGPLPGEPHHKAKTFVSARACMLRSDNIVFRSKDSGIVGPKAVVTLLDSRAVLKRFQHRLSSGWLMVESRPFVLHTDTDTSDPDIHKGTLQTCGQVKCLDQFSHKPSAKRTSI